MGALLSLRERLQSKLTTRTSTQLAPATTSGLLLPIAGENSPCIELTRTAQDPRAAFLFARVSSGPRPAQLSELTHRKPWRTRLGSYPGQASASAGPLLCPR